MTWSGSGVAEAEGVAVVERLDLAANLKTIDGHGHACGCFSRQDLVKWGYRRDR